MYVQNIIFTEQNRTEQNRTEQNRTEQNRTERFNYVNLYKRSMYLHNKRTVLSY